MESLSLGALLWQQSWGWSSYLDSLHNLLQTNGLGQLDDFNAYKVKNPGVDHNSFLTDGSISISVIEKMAHLLMAGE